MPSGTVTFLLTDVEGSTALWEEAPEAMRAALARHDALFDAAVFQHSGVHIRPRGEGDSRFAVFASASDAVAAALAIQGAFVAEDWPTPRPIKVRIGIHTGEAELRDGDYYGSAVNRCARLRDIGHGGQILLSDATAALAAKRLPDGASLRDRGEHRLKDLTVSEHVFQLVAPDLPTDHAPLTALQARRSNEGSNRRGSRAEGRRTYREDVGMPQQMRPALNDPHRRTSLAPRRHNLPLPISRFVGRDQEICDVRMSLSKHRLVTLTGTGGVGKTRLAIEAAGGLADRYTNGIWFVELAPLVASALVSQAVAAALRVPEQPGRSLEETLVEALCARDLLLVLDNCEHVVDACAGLVDALLHGCPGVRVLATSREPLNITGEEVRRVPSLSLPPSPPTAGRELDLPDLLRSEAVRLFIDRAGTIHPGIEFAGAALATTVEICRRLDGIPLAIELAAARLELLTLEQIAERLDERFRLLTAGTRTAPPRHRTLRAVVDWSYDLLSAPERALFRRLSVFAGGFGLEAAEAVGIGRQVDRRHLLHLLGALVTKSLVLVDMGGRHARYFLLETLREYGRERLVDAGEKQSTGRRHAAWCIDLVERAEMGLHGPDQRVWLRQLEEEQENARVALTSSLAEADQAEVALRLAGGLAWFWFVSGRFHEGRMWLEQSLLASAAADGLSESARRWRAKALLGGGRLAHYQGDYDRGSALLEESLALARAHLDSAGIAAASTALGHLALDRGDYDAARRLCHESLGLSLQRGDASAAGIARLLLGRLACAQGHLDAARLLFEQSLSSWHEARNGWGVAWALNYLGLLALDSGAVEQAESLLGESLELADALRDARGIGLALVGLGEAARRRGDLTTAEARIRESLLLHRDLGDRWSIAQCLDELAQIATLRQVPGLAVQLFAAARSLREAIGASLPAAQHEKINRSLADLRRVLNPAAFASEWATGTTIRVEQLLAAWPSPRPPGITAEPAALEVPQAPGGPLTRREAEVAALLARGYTNGQIAESLVLSVRTVEAHARSIRKKLSLASRAQLTS